MCKILYFTVCACAQRCILTCIVVVRESKIIFLLSKTEILCSKSVNLVMTINKGAFYYTQLHCLF